MPSEKKRQRGLDKENCWCDSYGVKLTCLLQKLQLSLIYDFNAIRLFFLTYISLFDQWSSGQS